MLEVLTPIIDAAKYLACYIPVWITPTGNVEKYLIDHVCHALAFIIAMYLRCNTPICLTCPHIYYCKVSQLLHTYVFDSPSHLLFQSTSSVTYQYVYSSATRGQYSLIIVSELSFRITIYSIDIRQNATICSLSRGTYQYVWSTPTVEVPPETKTPRGYVFHPGHKLTV